MQKIISQIVPMIPDAVVGMGLVPIRGYPASIFPYKTTDHLDSNTDAHKGRPYTNRFHPGCFLYAPMIFSVLFAESVTTVPGPNISDAPACLKKS